jgi:YggT family protein
MMGGAFQQVFVLLIQVIFGLYEMVILLRLLLRLVRADYHHPIVQAIVRLTKPPISILKRFTPDIRAIETASILLFILVDLIKLLLLAGVGGVMPNLVGLLVWSVGDLLSQTVQLLFYLIIIRAIMSWFNPNPMLVRLLNTVTDPILNPVKKHVPPLGGLDLSPLVAIVLLQIVEILLADPISTVGMRLALQ